MKLLLLLYALCISSLLFAQDYSNYAAVDGRALSIPKAQTFATKDIANFIQTNFTGDRDKIRAVYKWITANISYSKDSMYFSNWGGDPEVKMEATLRKRRGVCENYAGLFTNIIVKCGIQSVVVGGYTYLNGSVNMSGHSWCAVNVDKEWLLCDPTWDGGFANEARYFLVQPSDFIATHMPFDPLWQLIPYPISHKEFRKGYTSAPKKDTAVNVAATVNAYLAMDTLQQLETATKRIKEAGFDNEELKTWHAYNQMKVNIVYQEENMTLYNEAVEDLNKAKKQFNLFVKFRNEGTFAVKSPNEIASLFSSVQTTIERARKTAKKIGLKVENYQYDTGELLQNLDKISLKLKEQKEYYNSSVANMAAKKSP